MSNKYIPIPPFYPFKNWVCNNFPFIEETFDGITNYQLMSKIVGYLNLIKGKTNELGNQVNTLQDWFDNLDVQDEVDNKLDEMAESGELQEIIETYINTNGLIKYNTILEMKSATNLVNGSNCYTLGIEEKFDSNILLWIISENIDNERVSILLDNGLYAICLSKEINVKLLNLTNINDLSNYNLTKYDTIILDKNYTITDHLTLENITLDLNGKTISMDNNTHENLIADNNVIIKNGKINSVDYTNLSEGNGTCIKVIGDNVVIDNIDFNGYYSVHATTDVNNLEIKNCLLNSYRCEILLEKGRFKNINIHDNKQTREQNYTTPVQHHNIIQVYNAFSWNNNRLIAGELTKEKIDDYYGDNLIIDNNEFNTINTRATNIFNFHNVNITNNKCYNPFGDKTGHTLVGYSDDVYVIDLCKYCNIENNVVENSGENGIDVLASEYVSVINNKLIGIDQDGIDVNTSDGVAEGTLNADVTDSMRVSNNVTISGNNIETMSVGIRIAGRNISANGNVIYNHENPTTNRGLLFASNTALTNIGNYGTINGVGNNIADNMTLGFGSNGNVPFTNINSRIELDENSGLKMTKEIDNTTLANDSDVKLYAITHNVYFRNVKLYLINSNDNDRLLELPLTNYNNHGVANYDNGKYNFYINLYKHFTNIAQSAQSTNYYNLTAGTIKAIFY